MKRMGRSPMPMHRSLSEGMPARPPMSDGAASKMAESARPSLPMDKKRNGKRSAGGSVQSGGTGPGFSGY